MAWQQPATMALRFVSGDAALIFDAAGDALIDDARQALLGGASLTAQVCEWG
jgi:hypothetical protein